MAKKKAEKTDKSFMKNLGSAIKEEARKKSRAGLPAYSLGNGDGASDEAARPARSAPGTSTAKTGAGTTAAPGRGAAKAARPAGAEEAKAQLLKELKAILGKLDAEGLAFLLEQARVHLYNMEAERLDAIRGSLPDVETRPGASPGLRIERSESGSSYYVVLNGAYTMFTTTEMAALVHIAHGNEDDNDAGKGLENWFKRERTDALSELWRPVKSGHPLAPLAMVIKKTFKKPGA